MITNATEPKQIQTNKWKYNLEGLSTDTKPTTIDGRNVANGSRFYEMDTQVLNMFDEDSAQWVTPSTDES